MRVLTIAESAKTKREFLNFYKDQYKKGLSKVLKRSSIRYTADFLSSYLILASNLNYYPILNVRRDMDNEKNQDSLHLGAIL